MTGGADDEPTPLSQFFDALAVKPGSRDTRVLGILFTLTFVALTFITGVLTVQEIWAHHLWTGVGEFAATVVLCLVTALVALATILEWTGVVGELDH